LKVAWVPLADSPAQRAAWNWISSIDHVEAIHCPLARGTLDSVLDLQPDVVWIDGTAPLDDAFAFAAMAGATGTGFVLTGGAVVLPSLLGLETGTPECIEKTWNDEEDELFLFRDFAETPRIRGHAAFRRHRLFDGLGSGAYTWWPHDGDTYRALTWRLPDWPAIAGVVAVERAFIHIEHDRATIWEYAAPRIICIGAFLPFESNDPLFRPHRERLGLNALLHAAGLLPARQPDLHWRPPDPRRVHDPLLSIPPHVATVPPGERLPFHIATLRMPGGSGVDPVTLAGRRTMAAGTEARGITEVWCHPIRVMTAVRLPTAAGPPPGQRAEGGRAGEGRDPVPAEVTSLGLVRRFGIGANEIVERTFVPRDLPGFVIEWENTGAAAVDLEAEWETDLRLMWPYSAGVLGPIHWNTSDSVLRIAAPRSGETIAVAVSFVNDREGAADEEVVAFRVGPVDVSPPEAPPAGYPQPVPGSGSIPDTAAYRLPCSVHLRIPANARARLLVAAETSPGDDAQAILSALEQAPSLVRARAASLRRLQREHLVIVSPDSRLDEAVEWAKVRLDSYLVETPGVGRSLVAGYWASRPGWNDGRPGYAWYFGRDAVWTAFACLGAGLFDAARDVIAFLAAHQDLNGKILHECTTSGSVHYDAADSTPLWLLLVARYLAWTGDLTLVRAVWPAVEHAIAFCVSTDTDGDGLIENTRVGHGWIEFGRLGGGKATFYNAGIWTAALRELAIAAESIGERPAATALNERYRRAMASLEARFHDRERNRWALRVEPDDFTPTATHAVPLLLRAVEARTMGSWLDRVASDEFTADWGVRMVSRSDPDFDPGSYHGGAVWPLYTGWTSWAEFTAGRIDSGFRHWSQISRLAFERERGAWDEVLHGTDHRAIGVCPDQAWSTAMAISPLVGGLLGAEPDAPRNRLTLRPAFPDDWTRFEALNLRMGDALIDLRFRREGSRHIFRLSQEAGAVPVRLVFEPVVTGRAVVAHVDGEPAQLVPKPAGGRLLVPVQLILDDERVLELEIAE
jgi:glycogen debranching enzyme